MADNLITVTYGSQSLTGLDSTGAYFRTLAPIEGWDGSPGSTINLTPKPRSAGSFLSTTPQVTPRVIHLQGLIDAPTPDVLQAAIDKLNSTVAIGAATLSVTRGVATRSATVYRQDEVLVNEVTDTLAEWSVQCVAPDPRRFGSTLNGTAYLPTPTGGLVIPFTLPTLINSNASTTVVSLTNAGAFNGRFTCKLIGPLTNPNLSHIGPTGIVRVVSLATTVTAGDFITITDADTQRVTASSGASVDSLLTSRQWSYFEPGVNSWVIGSTVYDANASLVVSATPAF